MGPRARWSIALAAYAVLNAVLYASLLPLWEGFDEPFHYAYVERLATHGELPVPGNTPLSAELWESLHLAPGSHLVQRNLPFVTSFSEYSALAPAERRWRRERLMTLRPASRLDDAWGTSNYEAQQAPLAYLLMVVPDRLWAAVPLPARILRLRLVCAVTAGLLATGLTLWLATLLRLPAPAQYAAVFVALSSQMFYACVARVANEWLAIPLITLVLIAAIRFQREPRYGNAALFGAALAAGLLTKSYFLSWALFGVCVMLYVGLHRKSARMPVLLALGIVVMGAAPWYGRNLRLYGNLSGILLAKDVGLKDALRALPSLSWPKILVASAHGALWTGNNSFISFSAGTLNLVLALMLLAAALWLCTVRKASHRADEWLVAAGCLSYVPALLYYCGMLFAFTKDPGISVAPWYLQLLSAPVACLLFLGSTRSGCWGRWTGGALLVLSTYMLCATYLVKLIPLYSGYPAASIRLMELWRWYMHDASRNQLLASTALGSPVVIWILTGVVAVMACVLCFLLGRNVWRPVDHTLARGKR